MDYDLDLLKKMQGLKQAIKSVQEHNKDFYQILIITDHAKVDKEKVTRYLNGLKSSIQDEINMVQMTSIEEVYHFSLRVEEKMRKKFDNKNSGRGSGGRSSGGSYSGHNDDQKNKDEVGSSSQNQRGNNFNHFDD